MIGTPRPLVRIKRNISPSVLLRAYAVLNGMSADPGRFTAPSPPLTILKDQIVALEIAIKKASSRVPGASAVSTLERERLADMLLSEAAYVKTLCDASPEEAGVIIDASGFVRSKPADRENPLLEVKLGPASGTVITRAAVGLLLQGRTRVTRCFHWQWSADGGKTFVDVTPTPGGTTTITGLPAFTMIGFRVKVTTQRRDGEWTPLVSILVH